MYLVWGPVRRSFLSPAVSVPTMHPQSRTCKRTPARPHHWIP